MTLKVYNTLKGKKEALHSIEPGEINMYVCGPTVYDSSHIGHARSVVFFDVVFRYLKMLGLSVTYVRNFTDIDDKIIKRANELGISCKELSEKYINEFNRDMGALNVLKPTYAPKATDYIDEIIELIQVLVDKGVAYPVDGDVYFAVESYKDYGRLSGRRLEDMEAGSRIEVDKRKKNPSDFAVWKSAKPNEPSWESPWGQGRPGWHIECSAMSWKILGRSFDIHGGGKDLIFPHHENEIAQSEAAFDEPFVSCWMHNGFVNINSEKMSKSLGNTTMVKDILKNWHPEAVRLFLLSSHYRSPIDFNDQSVKESAGNLDKIYALMKRINDAYGQLGMLRINSTSSNKYGDFFKEFCRAMEDDFNTAKGLAVLFDAVKSANKAFDEINDDNSFEFKILIDETVTDIIRMTNILGIFSRVPDDYFDSKKQAGVKGSGLDEAEIDALVLERTEARKNKDFQRADEIRDQLVEMNIIIEDRAEGAVWKMNDDG